MGWSSEVEQLNVDESTPGGGAFGNWVLLNPNEVCHYTVERDDLGVLDQWAIDIISSTNSSRTDDPPLERFVLNASELRKSIIIVGVYSFRIRIQNVSSPATDRVTTNHWHRKNGVSL
jgi:hypothetical protein